LYTNIEIKETLRQTNMFYKMECGDRSGYLPFYNTYGKNIIFDAEPGVSSDSNWKKYKMLSLLNDKIYVGKFYPEGDDRHMGIYASFESTSEPIVVIIYPDSNVISDQGKKYIFKIIEHDSKEEKFILSSIDNRILLEIDSKDFPKINLSLIQGNFFKYSPGVKVKLIPDSERYHFLESEFSE
jgi:hypothetical protein